MVWRRHQVIHRIAAGMKEDQTEVKQQAKERAAKATSPSAFVDLERARSISHL